MGLMESTGQLANTQEFQAPDLTQPMHQGLQAGLQLAHQKNQLEQFKIEMDMKRSQLQDQMQEHFITGLENVHKLSIDNPQLAKKLYPGVWNTGAKLGVVQPLDGDSEKFLFGDNGDLMNTILQKAVKAFRTGGPADKSAAFEDLGKLPQGDQITLMNMYNNAVKPDVTAQAQSVRAGGAMGVAATNQGVNPGALADLLRQRGLAKDGSPEQKQLDTQIQGLLSQGKTQRQLGQGDRKLDQGDEKIDLDKAKLEELRNYHKLMAGRWAESMKARWAGLALGEQRLKSQGLNEVDKDTRIQKAWMGVQQADKAMTILQKEHPLWTDFAEANVDVASMMTPGLSSVVPQGRENKIDVRTMGRFVDQIGTYVSGHQTGGPSGPLLDQLKDTVGRLRYMNEYTHDQRLGELVNSQTRFRRWSSDDAKEAYETHRLNPETAYDPARGSAKPRQPYMTPKGVQQPVAAPSGGLKPASATFIQSVLQGLGGDKAKAKAFLDSKGFDSSGVQ